MRIWLYTPILHSASSIATNLSLATKCVELAKENIRYLTQLNNTTNLYRRLQVFYHQFLTTAIAVLFLASTHAPLQFSPHCRDEFYMALELIKDLSAKSYVSQRLWRTVRSLKAIAPRLGLREHEWQPSTTGAGMPISTVGPSQHLSPVMAGTTVPPSPSPGPVGMPPSPFGPRSESLSQPLHIPSSSAVTSPFAPPMQPHIMDDQTNGLRLQSEMSRIFEGYMGMNDGHSGHGIGGQPSPYQSGGRMMRLPNDAVAGGQCGGVYEQLREII